MDAAWLNRAGLLAEALAFLLIAPEIIGHERLRRVEAAVIDWGASRLSDPTRTWTGEREAATGPLRLLPKRPPPRGRSALWDIGDELGIVLYFVLLTTTVYLSTSPPISWAVFSAAIASYLAGFTAILLLRSPRLTLLAWPLAAVGLPSHWGRAFASDLCYFLVRAIISSSLRVLSGTDRLRALVFGAGVLFLFGGMGAQFVATF